MYKNIEQDDNWRQLLYNGNTFSNQYHLSITYRDQAYSRIMEGLPLRFGFLFCINVYILV